MTHTQERITIERHLSFVIGATVDLRRADAGLLDPVSLKRAYYRRAKEMHPDRAAGLGVDPAVLTERFRNLQNSYEAVLDFLDSGRLQPLLRGASNRGDATPNRPASAAGNAAGGGFGPGDKRQETRGSRSGNRGGAAAYRSWRGTPNQPPGRTFYRGNLPPFRLRLAEWLYYTGRVSFESLISALAWQYAERPKVGSIAVALGYLTHDSVNAVIRRRSLGEPFCGAAVRLGFLSDFERSVVLGRQRLMNQPIGSFFIERGIVDAAELERAVRDLWSHNMRSPSRAAM